MADPISIGQRMTTRLGERSDLAPAAKILEADVGPLPEAPCHEVARLPVIATQLIGERIRAMYGSMTREPVPTNLLDLVRELEDKERAR